MGVPRFDPAVEGVIGRVRGFKIQQFMDHAKDWEYTGAFLPPFDILTDSLSSLVGSVAGGVLGRSLKDIFTRVSSFSAVQGYLNAADNIAVLKSKIQWIQVKNFYTLLIMNARIVGIEFPSDDFKMTDVDLGAFQYQLPEVKKIDVIKVTFVEGELRPVRSWVQTWRESIRYKNGVFSVLKDRCMQLYVSETAYGTSIPAYIDVFPRVYPTAVSFPKKDNKAKGHSYITVTFNRLPSWT